jgi:SH3-like domain-containing protein
MNGREKNKAVTRVARAGAVITLALTMVLGGLAGANGAQAQSAKKTPYWASLSKGEAVMRVGPGKDYPANWVYQRRDLPVKVVMVHPDWRKVEDSDGATGWLHVRLLKDDPTAIVKGGTAELRDKPSAGSKLLHRLAPGVVGKISGCANGWCAFETAGQSGYVLAQSLWGATE